MDTAVIYCWISKDQHDDHLGVDRQQKQCRELADEEGLEVVSVLVDNDISASKGRRRPAFEELVEILKSGQAGTVITYHVDRLYRRTADLERLVELVEATGAQVRTVAAGDLDLSTASGRMVARMLGAVAQHEVERLGERLKAKSDELAARGRPPGGRPPFGYGPGYAVDPAESSAVRYMVRRILEGGSLLAVARELDDQGIPTRLGKRWHHSSVRATVINRHCRAPCPPPRSRRPRRLAARHRSGRVGTGHGGAVRPGQETTPPVVPVPAVRMVVSTGGDPMTGRPDHGAGGTIRRCYATRSTKRNPSAVHASVGSDDLDEIIVAAVLALLDGAVLPTPDTDPGPDVTDLEADLAELTAARGDGTISFAEWMAARGPLVARLEAAQTVAAPTPITPIMRRLSSPGAVRREWPEMDFETRRQIVTAVVEKVIVGPATKGRWTPTEDRVLVENGGQIVWKV